MSIQTDTIAAVATPAGPGAIGILRLSGPRAADIAAAVFRPLGKKGLLDRPVRTLVYGDLLDREGAVIDKVLATYTRGPASYTGEDTAELHCHGAPMVLSLGLESLFSHGARQARPGEFTRRAFLNGRLDLVQAEAVGDLLEASSREGARHAAGQLSGALSRRIGGIYSALVDVMAHFHAVLDYPDEDIDPFRASELAAARAALGDLDRIARCVKVLGMVNATPDFRNHPQVINGFSDLMVDVFGERGRHARSAVGMGSLPNGQTVEIEAIFAVTE